MQATSGDSNVRCSVKRVWRQSGGQRVMQKVIMFSLWEWTGSMAKRSGDSDFCRRRERSSAVPRRAVVFARSFRIAELLDVVGDQVQVVARADAERNVR